jgi:hypothetical protein
MPYITVFEITQKAFEWWWPAVGIAFVVIGAVLVRFGPKLDRYTSGIPARIIGWFFIIFASGWTLLSFTLMYSTYREYSDAYRIGRYNVVEGVVEDFRPMPYEGHQEECFRVRNQRFCYSDYELSPGFNQSASHGGPIRAGLPVRIAYYEDDEDAGDHILRLEVRADSLSSERERAAYARMEEQRWKQQYKDNPIADRFRLGFSFAVILISLCWNVDWQHYVRYYIKRDPPYSQLLEWAFRGFFLACLVGASIDFIRVITERHRTIDDFAKAALYSLIWIGSFGAYDLFVRLRLRAKNQAANHLNSRIS